MPAITLSNLAWSTPDGTRLFDDLTLGFGRERAGLIGRNGTGKTSLLRLIAGDLLPHSGSISVDGTIALLRQSVAPDEGETIADLFGVRDALDLLDRAARGDAEMNELAEADWTLESRIEGALAQLRLDAPLATPLSTLSGGQRTRAGLAAAILAEPDFLLLDEPTNNLDRDGRDAVLTLLAGWRAGAIVVSHDRELLEAMDAIVELTSLGATRYGGSWSAWRERRALELAAVEHDLADAERRLAQAARAAQHQAERKSRKDGAGKRKAAKGGQPRILLGAMKNRAEASSGDARRLAERQIGDARDVAEAARARVEVLKPITATLPPSGLPGNYTVVQLDRLTIGHDRPLAQEISYALIGPRRVAITGPNGSGKSTLLRVIAGQMTPLAGTVRVTDRLAMLDQQASLLDPSLSIRDNFARLNPGASENACRAALARFAFRADAALQIVGTLSGGQTLRAGLACTLGGARPPWLLILDEPTNHLDLDSIEAVEAGLSAYDGALLVVSHDAAFLDAIGIEERLALPG
ncbi:ABC-F family ATP-binding cassette domain-containing protein [Sphingomonas sp. HF-S3]|uniref:ABC-F family ATP-binding cassette domain-containing protein n=1 Tax=Sphingomonas rustica TaxID=3103142 RepID=A0ABV0B7E1_9SPHN